MSASTMSVSSCPSPPRSQLSSRVSRCSAAGCSRADVGIDIYPLVGPHQDIAMHHSSIALQRTPLFAVIAGLCLFTCVESKAVTLGQVDTFQDGSTMNWQEGGNSPNPPTNVASGGPAGAGDRYLENDSSGGFGAGSR